MGKAVAGARDAQRRRERSFTFVELHAPPLLHEPEVWRVASSQGVLGSQVCARAATAPFPIPHPPPAWFSGVIARTFRLGLAILQLVQRAEPGADRKADLLSLREGFFRALRACGHASVLETAFVPVSSCPGEQAALNAPLPQPGLSTCSL